jgi:hypothetical protein
MSTPPPLNVESLNQRFWKWNSETPEYDDSTDWTKFLTIERILLQNTPEISRPNQDTIRYDFLDVFEFELSPTEVIAFQNEFKRQGVECVSWIGHDIDDGCLSIWFDYSDESSDYVIHQGVLL